MPATYYVGVAMHLAAALLWVGALSVLALTSARIARAWRAAGAP